MGWIGVNGLDVADSVEVVFRALDGRGRVGRSWAIATGAVVVDIDKKVTFPKREMVNLFIVIYQKKKKDLLKNKY